MAVISKGITLSYKNGEEYTVLENLQEIPSVGGTTESIEITTLADAAHMYTKGLITYGDSLAFKFLYGDDNTQFMALHALEGEQDWKVTLPDGAACTFKGEPSVSLDSAGIAVALTYTLAIQPTSLIEWA
jgi:hypothetical protein